MREARYAILNAAIQLFARKGYAASSIREICHTAGVTKPVLYYHFHSKEHLYHELMLDIFSQSRKNLLRASNIRGSLRERLVQYLTSDFRDCKKDPVLVRFLFRMMFSPEEEYPYFNYMEEFERQRQVIAGFISEGSNSPKAQKNASVLATALMGMRLIAVLEHIFTRRPTLTRKSAEKYVDILLPSRGEG
jgi:AcrR family transcriptional regulator